MGDRAAKTLTLSVFEISRVPVPTAAANAVRVVKPEGLPPQPWNVRRHCIGILTAIFHRPLRDGRDIGVREPATWWLANVRSSLRDWIFHGPPHGPPRGF